MRQPLVASVVCISLLVIAQAATAADCLIYEASIPTSLLQSQQPVVQTAYGYSVVVRLPGFKENQVDFLIFPPAIAKERLSLADAMPRQGAEQTTITPRPPGLHDSFPMAGHIVAMSNSAFYADLNTTTSPSTVGQVADAATDLAKAELSNNDTNDTTALFSLSPATTAVALNVVFVPAGADATHAPHPVPATQGTIQLNFLDEGHALFGAVDLRAVDDTANPAVDLQYTGIVDGKFMKKVNC